MDITQATNFLVGSILISFGAALIGILIVFLNNIFVRFWKPVNFGYWAPKTIHDIVEKGGQPPKTFMSDADYAEYQKSKSLLPQTAVDDEQPKIEPKLDK